MTTRMTGFAVACDLLERALGGLDHILAELVLRLVDARRIEKDNLRLWPRENAENPVARRLRLVAHDGDLLPDQAVDECRFADVRPTDDGDESRFMLFLFHSITLLHFLRCPAAP